MSPKFTESIYKEAELNTNKLIEKFKLITGDNSVIVYENDLHEEVLFHVTYRELLLVIQRELNKQLSNMSIQKNIEGVCSNPQSFIDAISVLKHRKTDEYR